jgi:hypothetical protein
MIYQHRRMTEGILHKTGEVDRRIIINYGVEDYRSLDRV